MHALVLGSIPQTLTDWVAQHGAYAIFAITAVDAVLPAGGELTMLVAGAVAGRRGSDHVRAEIGLPPGESGPCCAVQPLSGRTESSCSRSGASALLSSYAGIEIHTSAPGIVLEACALPPC